MGPRLWGQMFGGVDNRDQDAAGYRLDYSQDYFGAELGYDVIRRDDFQAGVMAGYLTSRQRFDGNGDRSSFDTFNIGAYAGVRKGPVFGNLLIKYDHSAIDARGASQQWSGKFDADTLGVSFEAGATLGGARFAFEPIAALTWTSASIDEVELLGQGLEFGTAKGLRGKAGARVSHVVADGQTKIRLYGSGQYVHEFKGRDRVTLSSGGISAAIRDRALGDYGEAKLGLSIASDANVSGFIEGSANFGKSYSGGGGRVGLRIAF